MRGGARNDVDRFYYTHNRAVIRWSCGPRRMASQLE